MAARLAMSAEDNRSPSDGTVTTLHQFNKGYTKRFGKIVEEVLAQGWDDCGRFELVQQIEGDEETYITEDGILWDHGDGCIEEYELEELVDDDSGDFNLIDPDTLNRFNALCKRIRECGFVIDTSAKMGEKVKVKLSE
jgi:hypothetical protein